MKQIYLDTAATTKVDPEVFGAMKPFFQEKYGNPSEPHQLGLEGKAALEGSREIVALFLGAKKGEIVFTGSATESINLAIKGLIEEVREGQKSKPGIIISRIEHKAVVEACEHLSALGWAEVSYLDVDRNGLVRVSDIKKMVDKNTVLISVMYVNNEVGTVQEISKIGKLVESINRYRKRRIYFHTDATQAIAYQKNKVSRLGVDLLSFSGHKIHAPKGVGVLYVKEGTPVRPQIDGGGQENNMRSGTENVAYIVGLGRAVELIMSREGKNRDMANLRDFLIEGVLGIPGTILTGHPLYRSPHIASFIIKGIEGESLVLRLSEKGIFASSGSACSSRSLSPSHVLKAMGYSPEDSHGSVRFSLGKETTRGDIELLRKVLPDVVDKLRKMSPYS